MERKRNIRRVVETQTTADDQVITTKTTSYQSKVLEEDYVKVYLRTLSAIHNVKGAAVKTLAEMLRFLDYNNQILLVPARKKEMSERSGLKVNTIEHNLRALCDAGILQKQATNVYTANPYMFGRGTWESIVRQREELPLEVVFSEGQVRFEQRLPEADENDKEFDAGQ